jgi:hypothetical protein
MIVWDNLGRNGRVRTWVLHSIFIFLMTALLVTMILGAYSSFYHSTHYNSHRAPTHSFTYNKGDHLNRGVWTLYDV